MKPAALIFDVFGTLVDWRGSVAQAVTAALGPDLPLPAEAFADRWRALYDPAMDPIRRGVRAYQPLDVLHRENLDRVLADLGLADRLDAAGTAALARCWERLDPWPDVPAGLRAIHEQALVAPCSNGSIALMVRLARHADLAWDTVLGADFACDYKPAPAVYRASCAALGLDPARVMMVAAHNADLHAARAEGLQTAFVPRPLEHGPGQTVDLEPESSWTLVARDMGALADRLKAL